VNKGSVTLRFVKKDMRHPKIVMSMATIHLKVIWSIE